MLNKVLVVNDDMVSQMIARIVIDKAKFAKETITAFDGKQALAYFEEGLEDSSKAAQLPEFIFLDLHMPVMNGWDFLDIFSEKFGPAFPHIQIAVMSAYISDAELRRLCQYGIVLDYIPAPIDINKLSEIKKKIDRFRHAA